MTKIVLENIYYKYKDKNVIEDFKRYIIIWCVMMSFSIVNEIVKNSNAEGIVEQIFMSSYSISAYIFIQVCLKSIYSMFFIWMILWIVNLFTGFLTLTNMVSFIITLLLGVLSIIGVGYIITGISILINNQMISLGLKVVFLYAIIGTDENIFLPFSKCKIMLADLIINNQCLWQQSISDIVVLCVNSLLFLVLGYFFFYAITSRELKLKADY